MKTKLIIALTGIILAAVVYSEPKKSDTETLQGKWQGTEKDAAADAHCYLTITGTNLSFVEADTNGWCKGTFTIREDTTPKQFVGVIKDCPTSDCIGVTVCAIYRLENGKFTICGNPPGQTNFPSSFDAPGSRTIVFQQKEQSAKPEK